MPALFTRMSILLYFFTPFSTAELAVDSLDTSPITEIESIPVLVNSFSVSFTLSSISTKINLQPCSPSFFAIPFPNP